MSIGDIKRANAASYMPLFNTQRPKEMPVQPKEEMIEGLGSINGGKNSARIDGLRAPLNGVDTTSRMDAIDRNVLVPEMKNDKLGQRLELFA